MGNFHPCKLIINVKDDQSLSPLKPAKQCSEHSSNRRLPSRPFPESKLGSFFESQLLRQDEVFQKFLNDFALEVKVIMLPYKEAWRFHIKKPGDSRTFCNVQLKKYGDSRTFCKSKSPLLSGSGGKANPGYDVSKPSSNC